MTGSLTLTGSISSVTPRSSWAESSKSGSGDWTTILSTATWASAYFGALSEGIDLYSSVKASISAMKASSLPTTLTISVSSTSSKSSNPTSNPSTTSTLTPTMTYETSPSSNANATAPLASSSSTPALDKTWIIGPIIGSLLGLSSLHSNLLHGPQTTT